MAQEKAQEQNTKFPVTTSHDDDVKDFQKLFSDHPFKGDWTQVRSDHLFQITNITPEVKLLTWNIMAQGKLYPDGKTNNSFDKEETSDEYKQRLIRIADTIASQISHPQSKVGVVTLQAVPQDLKLRQIMLDQLAVLKEHEWEPLSSQQGEHEFGQMTLINKDLVEKAVLSPKLPKLSTDHQNQALVTDITLKGEKEPKKIIRIANIHFSDKEKPTTLNETKADIDTLLNSTKEQVVIAGDFNRSLIDCGFTNCCFLDKPTSYEHPPGLKDASIPRNSDGFVFKYPPETYNFTETEKTAAVTKPKVTTEDLFTKTISVAALVKHFKDYKVSTADRNSVVTIQDPKTNDTVIIRKDKAEKLQFTASNNDPKIIAALNEALKVCLPKETSIKIEVSGGTKEQCTELQNQLWLDAIQNGFKVVNFKPDSNFLEQHKDELPVDIRDRLSFTSIPGGPGR